MDKPKARSSRTPKRFDSDAIPPVISLLLDDRVWRALEAGADQFTREMRSLIPELKRQARWTHEHFNYFTPTDVASSSLVVTASGALNPLSPYGICSRGPCRVLAANNMARTLGLYADYVLLPDIPTLHMRYESNPITDLFRLCTYILVLRVLEPMIRAGVVRFWRGAVAACAPCSKALRARIPAVVEELLSDGRSTPVATIKGNIASVDLESLFGQSIIYSRPLTSAEKNGKNRGLAKRIGREFYVEVAQSDIWATLLDLRYSSSTHASLFSTRRESLRALRAFDSDAPALNTVAAWESARSVELPWVSDLSVEQVLQLRSEAASALPSFRDSFVRQITKAETAPADVGSAIAGLQAEAAQIRTELDSARPRVERAFRATFGLLGMSLAVYAAATGNPAIEVGAGIGLLNALGYLHARGKDEHKARVKAESSPAYVLVKAKELSDHAQ